MRWQLIAAFGGVAAFSLAVGCGVDTYLTCGAACDDAGDATTNDAGGDGPIVDASPKDVQQPFEAGGCSGASCTTNGQCCSSDPLCTAGHKCATTCGAVDASCSSFPDTCCVGLFCNASNRCSACLPADASCTEDWQCCSGACPNGVACQ